MRELIECLEEHRDFFHFGPMSFQLCDVYLKKRETVSKENPANRVGNISLVL